MKSRRDIAYVIRDKDTGCYLQKASKLRDILLIWENPRLYKARFFDDAISAQVFCDRCNAKGKGLVGSPLCVHMVGDLT